MVDGYQADLSAQSLSRRTFNVRASVCGLIDAYTPEEAYALFLGRLRAMDTDVFEPYERPEDRAATFESEDL